ncbi:MAG: CPBP family intramembrane metalloprotease [Oscillospiraceae bacterium]|nr:CPBP family intramembrane metalloprotease [Oscillospiraceae bacterium]
MDNNFNNTSSSGSDFSAEKSSEIRENTQREVFVRETGFGNGTANSGQGQPGQAQTGQWQYQPYRPDEPNQPQQGCQNQPQSSQQPQQDQLGHTPYSGYRPYTSYQPTPTQSMQSAMGDAFSVTYPERKAIKSQYFGVFSKGIIHAVGSFAIAQILFIAMSMNGYTFRTDDEGAQIMDWKYLLAGTLPSVTVCLLLFIWDKFRGRVSFKSYFSAEKISGRQVLGFFGAFMLAFSAGQLGQYVLYIACLIFGVSPISESYATVPQYDTPYFIVTFIMTVFLGPIAEELMFRGVVLRGLSKVSGRFAIFMSAAMFGLMHGNLTQAFCAFVMGIVFGYAAVKTDSLVLPILGHITANFVTTTTMLAEYFLGEEIGSAYWFAVLGLFGIIGLIAVIAMYSKGYIRFPEYSEYHRKRTMPIVITCISFWVMMVIYWVDILSKFELVE